MDQMEFDTAIMQLKNADHAREQADMLKDDLLTGAEMHDPYTWILIQVVSNNICHEEFGKDGIYHGGE